MPITGIEFDTTVVARIQNTPSGSNIDRSMTMKIANMTSIIGTYDEGGIVLEPEYFGFETIAFLSTQGTFVYNLEGTNYLLNIFTIDFNPDTQQWKMYVHLNSESGWVEVDDGEGLTLPDGKFLTMLVCGY